MNPLAIVRLVVAIGKGVADLALYVRRRRWARRMADQARKQRRGPC